MIMMIETRVSNQRYCHQHTGVIILLDVLCLLPDRSEEPVRNILKPLSAACWKVLGPWEEVRQQAKSKPLVCLIHALRKFKHALITKTATVKVSQETTEQTEWLSNACSRRIVKYKSSQCSLQAYIYRWFKISHCLDVTIVIPGDRICIWRGFLKRYIIRG